MKTFTSIESLRHVIQNVRRHCNKHGIPFPTVTFTGTVKLHGTNAGVRVVDGKVKAQGRNRELDVTADNYGFARFVHEHALILEMVAGFYRGHYGIDPATADITLFGEWAGQGIQTGVGVSQVPKHFIIFAVWDNINEEHLPLIDMTHDFMQHVNAAGIYSINQIPTYEVTIDFSDAEASANRIIELTLAVETECPWAKFRGIDNGVGEGIVWAKADELGNTFWWFKSKGEKHQKGGKEKKTNVQVDTRKIHEINALVEEILPEGRLIQGISYLKENGINVDVKSTGQYIGWVAKDTAKEEYDTIAASGMDWKVIQGSVVSKARQWFFTYLDTQHD